MSFSESLLGPAAALASSAFWAMGVSQYALLSQNRSSYVVNLNRTAVALVALLSWAAFWVSRQSGPELQSALSLITPARLGLLFISVLGSYALADSVFMAACRRIGVPAALTIASIYPLWAALVGIFFRGQVATPSLGWGLLLVVGGVVTVVASGREGNTSPSNSSRENARVQRRSGYLLALLVSGLWTLNTVTVGAAAEGLPLPLASATRMGVAFLACIFSTVLLGRVTFRDWFLSAAEWKRSGPILVIESIFGGLCFVYGLSHSSVAVGAALVSVAPVLSVPVSLTLGTEAFSWLKALGIGLTFWGIVTLL